MKTQEMVDVELLEDHAEHKKGATLTVTGYIAGKLIASQIAKPAAKAEAVDADSGAAGKQSKAPRAS